MKLKALIKRLETGKVAYHDEEVEFVICTTKGEIITMDLVGQAPALVKLLKHFKSADPQS